jgi:hypothetical protein
MTAKDGAAGLIADLRAGRMGVDQILAVRPDR